MHTIKMLVVSCTIIFTAMLMHSARLSAATPETIPAKGMVTLVDLGATTCIPCRMMAPILEELKEEYKGKAEVIFIDVWDKANAGKAQAFKIMAIPTQVFFDKQGREVYRHTGFLDKKTIVEKLEELLAQ